MLTPEEFDDANLPAFNSAATSVFRNDRTSELEIKSERDDRVGGNSRVGQLAVHREPRDRAARPVVAGEAGVAIIELGDDIVRDRVGDTATAGQTVSCDIERIDGSDKRGIGMLDTAEGITAIEVEQPAVGGKAGAHKKRAGPAKIIRIDRGDARKRAGVELVGIVALDSRPGQIAFDADDKAAALPSVADVAAGKF